MSFSLMKCSEIWVLTTTTSTTQFKFYPLIFCHLLRTYRTYLRCRGISRVANRVAIAIYLLLNKSLKLCCRSSIDVNGSNSFHVVGSICHIADTWIICKSYALRIFLGLFHYSPGFCFKWNRNFLTLPSIQKKGYVVQVSITIQRMALFSFHGSYD